MGGNVLDTPTDVFGDGSAGGTIIDSGTTLAYLPDGIYTPIMQKVGKIFNTSSTIASISNMLFPYIIRGPFY